MGNSYSNKDSFNIYEKEVYHVVKVYDNSPAYKAGVEPYFDYICSIDGIRLNGDNNQFNDILKACTDRSVPIILYSSKSRAYREITIKPSNDWGGNGLLGISLRLCSLESCLNNVWHVLEVTKDSPSDIAGLRPFSDYIIGMQSSFISSELNDLYEAVENHINKPLKLFVYNSQSDVCREVIITPTDKWSGNGLIGCEIGTGYLHRIPGSFDVSNYEKTFVPVNAHLNTKTLNQIVNKYNHTDNTNINEKSCISLKEDILEKPITAPNSSLLNDHSHQSSENCCSHDHLNDSHNLNQIPSYQQLYQYYSSGGIIQPPNYNIPFNFNSSQVGEHYENSYYSNNLPNAVTSPLPNNYATNYYQPSNYSHTQYTQAQVNAIPKPGTPINVVSMPLNNQDSSASSLGQQFIHSINSHHIQMT